ncbi:tRNA (guanine-N(7)-)-methyltransferase non-catalytic subunit trm82 [Apiospora arundinis]
MAPLPFQFLCALGQDGILCASRGDSLYTFAADCSLITEHTLSSRGAAAAAATQEGAKEGQDGSSETATSKTQGGEEVNESSTPPPKRRKVDPEANGSSAQPAVGTAEPQAQQQAASAANGSSSQKKKKAEKSAEPAEKSYVILLKATGNGSHVVAVTGGNKTVCVLEHDGKGHLTELSQRQMVKRPSDVVLTADEKTILVADKFGDVYALPLVPSADDLPGEDSAAALQESIRLARKGANNLTVHTQRNLRSLEEQARQRAEKAKQQQEQKETGPTFKQDLLLGHVSMLTSVAVGSANGRPYILTADRDEHIRVSRGILSMAHIIEHFCLGHKAFVSTMRFPQPDVLVSGGGDNELYVWDWVAGKLKSKVPLLQHAKEQASLGADKIAVTGLYPCNVPGGAVLLMAICERVKAIFVYRVEGSNLTFVETISLAGYPLDIAFIQVPGEQQSRMVVSLDQGAETSEPSSSSSGLYVHMLGNGSATAEKQAAPVYPNPEGGRVDDLPRAEIEKILYTVGNLRKTEFDDVAAGGDDDAAGAAGAPAPEAAEGESSAP